MALSFGKNRMIVGPFFLKLIKSYHYVTDGETDIWRDRRT